MALTPSQKANLLQRISNFKKEIINIQTRAQREIATKEKEIIRLEAELAKG